MAGGFSTTVTIDGLESARRIAQRVVNLGHDPRPLLEIAGALMERSVINRFDTESGPGGVPWPKSKRAEGLAPNYRGQKVAGKTLQDSGDLRDSLRQEIDSNSVAVGFDGLKNPVKAIANQVGSNRQAVVVGHTRVINQAFGVPLKSPKTVNVRPHGMVTNLPARPMIGFDAQDRADLEEQYQDFMIDLLHG